MAEAFAAEDMHRGKAVEEPLVLPAHADGDKVAVAALRIEAQPSVAVLRVEARPSVAVAGGYMKLAPVMD